MKKIAFAEHIGSKMINGKEVDIIFTKVNGELKVLYDYKYPIWITGKPNRNYTQKKEYQSISKTNKIMTTLTDMPKEIAKIERLGTIPEMATLQHLKDFPYLYGGNMVPTSYFIDDLLKKGYKFDVNYVALDTETYMGTNKLSHISICSQNIAYVGVMRNRFPGWTDKKIKEEVKENYIKFVPEGGERWESRERVIIIYDELKDMLVKSFLFLDRLQPDIVGIWNMDWDISELDRSCKEVGLALVDLLHNKKLGDNLKHYVYKPGVLKKVTVLDDGTEKPKTYKSHEVWGDLKSSASYKIIDAMALFYHRRSQTPDLEGGFSLQNVGEKMIKLGKMEEGTDKKGKEKHIYLSDNKPAFYTAYSMFDSELMIEVNNKTNDVLSGVRSLGRVPWNKLSSLPYTFHVNFQFYLLERGFTVGTRSYHDPVDPILGIGEGWIVTQPAYRLFVEKVEKIFNHVYDLDEESAYPFTVSALNIDASTTMAEVIEVSGLPRVKLILNFINMVISKVNSLSVSGDVFGAPDLEEVVKMTKPEFLKKYLIN